MWYSWRIVKREIFASLCLSLLCGCSTRSPLLRGDSLIRDKPLSRRDAAHRQLTGKLPARQQAAGTLKTTVTATVGGSAEFFRLVDLDVRKREFIITLSDGSVRADRTQEMKDELIKMDEEIVVLKPVVRSQVAALPLRGEAQQQVERSPLWGCSIWRWTVFHPPGRADSMRRRPEWINT